MSIRLEDVFKKGESAMEAVAQQKSSVSSLAYTLLVKLLMEYDHQRKIERKKRKAKKDAEEALS